MSRPDRASGERYNRPLEQLSFSARSRRLKNLALHPIVDGLQRKICAVCCTEKPLDAYRRRRDDVFGHDSYCIASAADRRSEVEQTSRDGTDNHRQRRFGVDAATFDAMLAVQDGCCAVCQTAEPSGVHPWAIDHDQADIALSTAKPSHVPGCMMDSEVIA